MSSHGHHVEHVVADLRKYARDIPSDFQRATSITPSLLLAAADYLAQRYLSKDDPPEMMCGRCKSDFPCICDEPIVYQRVRNVAVHPATKHCLNPETCNPDKGAHGCVCTCRPCKENPLAEVPAGVLRWQDIRRPLQDIRRPLPEERVSSVNTYAPTELRALMLAAVESSHIGAVSAADRAAGRRLRQAADAYAAADRPQHRELRADAAQLRRELQTALPIKCIYSDCGETQDLQVSHVCLKHILRDEEAHDRALASAFFHVLCTLESYKYTDWEFVDDDADEDDPKRQRAEATSALIEAIIHDVKTLAKARGVKPAPDDKENG